jgi:hypothetical protein
MNNQEKYKFEEFTITNYRKMIQIAKNNNCQFKFFFEKTDIKSKAIFWRHDVEFSPFVALNMAEIEASEGVKATYFFQLHAEFYNVLEKAISEIVFKIKSYGHDIGLHFDSHYFNVTTEKDLEKYLALDTRFFNEIFNMDVKVFSFHNTNDFVLSCEEDRYAGLINVYSKYFKENFSYCADSTGYWRYERLADVLNNPAVHRLQVLTHDAMWSKEILPPRQRVFLSIDENAQRIKKWYDSTLKIFKAKNVDLDNVYE